MAATETEADREAIAAANARGEGRSIDDMADGDDALEEEEDGQITIAGTKSNLTPSAGGRKPDVAKATIRSITLPVTGQFEKGERVRVTIDLTCTQVTFQDEEDAHGKIVRTTRKHVFRPDDILDVVVPG